MPARSSRGLLERLKTDVVVGAEGYVFELERRGYIKAGPYVPEVVLDFPDALRELHREFLRAGADVMVALTYYAHRQKLKTVGRENDLEALNRQAVRLANEVAREGDALVAGDICNTWAYDPKDKEASSKVVRRMYEEQLSWAVEEGIDFVIAETNDYLGEALIALEVIKQLQLPAMITLATAQQVPYKTNPLAPTFESLRTQNGEQAFPIMLEPFLCTRFEMAAFARQAHTLGVNYIGVCCGGAPHYVRAMAEALGRTVPASKYSPAMELHPMLGSQVSDKDSHFLTDWKS